MKPKYLVFSPSSGQEHGRGRGREFLRGRGRSSRSSHDDRDELPSYPAKKYNQAKGNEKSTDLDGCGVEDGRIGRQLRLLARETDEDSLLKICQQLQVEIYFIQVFLPQNWMLNFVLGSVPCSREPAIHPV